MSKKVGCFVLCLLKDVSLLILRRCALQKHFQEWIVDCACLAVTVSGPAYIKCKVE